MYFFNSHNIKAALIHLGISLLIALMSLLLVYGIWYPSPLDAALGVSAIFLLMLTIDIVLGPLMTLVVYRPRKSSLKFDLTAIAAVQLVALIYGLYTVGSGRPVYMVYTKDRFDLVLAYEVPNIVGSASQPALAMQSPWAQPLVGYALKSAKIPDGINDGPVLDLLMNSALSGGPDVGNVPAFQDSYVKALPKIKAKALALTTIKVTDPIIKARVTAMQAKYPANSIVTPLKIKYTIYTVVMNPLDASILGIEPIDVF
jgi:hypothetical protein